jgi:hypothetical protein
MKKLILSLVFISTISIQAGHHEMAKDAKSVVKKAYATFASGDTEAWTALHAKDLTFTVFGDIPTTGKHIGPDAVIKNVLNQLLSTGQTLISSIKQCIRMEIWFLSILI